jgi:hypothetical protein
MEDFYVDYLPGIKFDKPQIADEIKKIQSLLESTKKNNFEFLCDIRKIVELSSHGDLILRDNEICYLKYSWVNDDYTVLTILEKMFGFCSKYIEHVVRVINKFIVQDAGVLKYKFEFLKDLTISKLQELLSLSFEQIKNAFDKKDLTYKSTKKEIREYVKSLESGTDKADKVLEETDSEEDVEITDCGQYIKFSAENFEYLKEIVRDKKNKYSDTSDALNAILEYCKEHKLFI